MTEAITLRTALVDRIFLPSDDLEVTQGRVGGSELDDMWCRCGT